MNYKWIRYILAIIALYTKCMNHGGNNVSSRNIMVEYTMIQVRSHCRSNIPQHQVHHCGQAVIARVFADAKQKYDFTHWKHIITIVSYRTTRSRPRLMISCVNMFLFSNNWKLLQKEIRLSAFMIQMFDSFQVLLYRDMFIIWTVYLCDNIAYAMYDALCY